MAVKALMGKALMGKGLLSLFKSSLVKPSPKPSPKPSGLSKLSKSLPKLSSDKPSADGSSCVGV
ncbi:hypothetical protein [Moraxella lacunata]|uniref:hypothetical protein n=1 Tax=Moraxella lacunata TaxID=477 RepID=UPI003EE393E8